MNRPDGKRTGSIGSLNGLKAAAMILVFWWHSPMNKPDSPDLGLRMCEIFFVLSGFLFGSLSAILFSLSGGVLSLLVMLLIRKRPESGAVCTILMTAAAEIYLLSKNPHPQGEMLITVILIGLAFAAGIVILALTHQGTVTPVMGTSLAGAVTHNIGQVLMACLVMNNTRLLISYLPALIGIGAAVGCLTGIVTDRVLKVLKLKPNV